MTPTDYAAEELDLWERALEEQCAAEARLKLLRREGRSREVLDLLPELHAMRRRADLLLADAVKVKCTYRDHSIVGAWVSTTQTSLLEERAEGKH